MVLMLLSWQKVTSASGCVQLQEFSCGCTGPGFIEFSGVITLNCALIKSNSTGLNSFAVRKSSAVPTRKMSLHASFKEGTGAAAACAPVPVQAAAAAMAARKSRRESIKLLCSGIGPSASLLVHHLC